MSPRAAVCVGAAGRSAAGRALFGALIGLTISAGARAAGPDDAPPGASSCSGCHAPAGGAATAIAPIAGRDAGGLVQALEAFRAGTRPATVMDRIVKGFSPEEVRVIAAWLASRK